MKFTGLSGNWKTTNSVFATDNLSMLSPYFNINGTGTADVANQKLDIKLRIWTKTQDPKRPFFAPLRITGTFFNPKFSLDLKDLIKALSAQDLKKLELEVKVRIEKAKADAIQKLKSKTGDKLCNQIINKLTGNKPKSFEGQAIEEKPKSAEDQVVKDKLKDKLKSLF